MSRRYIKIKQHYDTIIALHEAGNSYREIGEKLGFTRDQIKECVRRPKRQQQSQVVQIPKRRGRKSKGIPQTWSAMEQEVLQLRIENELLRDFLKLVERR